MLSLSPVDNVRYSYCCGVVHTLAYEEKMASQYKALRILALVVPFSSFGMYVSTTR